MKLKPIPISKAKTAWGLLGDVERAILAEPKRADMGDFIQRRTPEFGGPACGTVGCFAGWVCLLRGIYRTGDELQFEAESILGENNYFFTAKDGSNAYVFNGGWGDACVDYSIGTLPYARAVVARIRRFKQKNEKALKARKLPAVSR